MTKYHFVVLFISVFSASQFCNADDILSDNRITVFGKAEVSAPADHAKVSFTVSGYGPSLRGAVEKAKKQIEDISAKLVELGLKKENLNTSYFYSGEYQGGKPFLSNKKDYCANITMYVSVNNLSLLESVLFLLSESNVDTISKVQFSLKDDIGFKQKARQLAVQKAQSKAIEFAQQLKISVGKATLIEEIPQITTYPEHSFAVQEYLSNASLSMLKSESAVREGTGYFTDTVQVYSAVKVVFKINE